jgi:hypothetical protein
MPWLIALNIALYIASVIVFLYVAEGLIIAIILFVLAGLLTLILSGGSINSFDIF